MINIRTKGQVGEREVADHLNAVIKAVREALRLPPMDEKKPEVQRNQNQSAVGGCDLTGTYGLAIEVKRQEQLAINTWWAQCVASAKARNEIPVLVFRQNAKPGQRTKWRCITTVELFGAVAYYDPMSVRAEIDYNDFLEWFRRRVTVLLKAEHPQVEEGIIELPVRARVVNDPAATMQINHQSLFDHVD